MYKKELSRLPEHLRCTLPLAGILTAIELREAVDLVLEFQDIFEGPYKIVQVNSSSVVTLDMPDAPNGMS